MIQNKQLHTFSATAAKISLLALFAFPLLPLRLAGFLILPFGLFSFLAFLSTEKRNFDKKANSFLLVCLLLPVIYLTELFYADSVDAVWSIVQRKMALLVMPVAVWLLYASGESIRIRLYLYVFTIATFLSVLIGAGFLMFNGFLEETMQGGFAYALRTTVEHSTGLHPTYFSLYIGFSVLFLIGQLATVKSPKLKILNNVGIVILTGALLALSARMAIGAWGIALIVLLIQYRKELKKVGITLLGLFILIPIVVVSVPSLRMRVAEVFSKEQNSTNIRSVINECSVDQLSEHWLWGSGVEHLQDNLNRCYASKNHPIGNSPIVYNTHNEYLNIWCGKGLPGIISFLLLLIVLFGRARKSPEFVSFLIMFALVCLTENLLERQLGVFFLAVIGITWGALIGTKNFNLTNNHLS